MATHFEFIKRQAMGFDDANRSLFNCYVNAPSQGWDDDIYKSYYPYVRYVKRESEDLQRIFADLAKAEERIDDRALNAHISARERLEAELRKLK